jgi:two-component system phosphate regulon sensor histidine kinase PhoR
LSRKIGIFWKYFIAYSAIATIVIFVLIILMNLTIRERYQQLISDELTKSAFFAREAIKPIIGKKPSEVDKIAKELGRQTGIRVTIIATDGIVLGDSQNDPTKMENHSERPEIKDALSGRISSSIRYSTTLNEKMDYVAVPLIKDGKINGVVRLSLETNVIEFIIGDLTHRVVFISVFAWIITLILTLLFSSIFSSSVKQMVGLTRQLAGGDFSKRAVIRRRDELGELAIGLNEMSDRIQSLFNQLQIQHDELGAIIDSMTEGVLVLDSRLCIRLANNSFKEMFSIENDVTGKLYIEVVRFAGLKEIIDELPKLGQIKSKKMKFSRKIFLVNGIALVNTDEKRSYVIVFHDATLDSQIEVIKADFVANASHELRTPITAIKGYLETFEDEDTETQKSFIQIIRRNVDRISNLVSDLLFLSRLEASTPQVNFEATNFIDIADNVLKLIERIHKNKGINLKTEIAQDVIINCDPFLLEQMLLNLLDNAIKYTEKGEVVLRARNEGNKVMIQVSDTGIGIPSKHLPHIFERFYRIDKGRSRDLGGTGLGLSIVKHIVQLHNGEIHVESLFGEGTTFTIWLPSGLPLQDASLPFPAP